MDSEKENNKIKKIFDTILYFITFDFFNRKGLSRRIARHRFRIIIYILLLIMVIVYKYWLLLLIVILLALLYSFIRKIIDMDLRSSFNDQLIYYNESKDKTNELKEIRKISTSMYIIKDIYLKYIDSILHFDYIFVTKRNIYFIYTKDLIKKDENTFNNLRLYKDNYTLAINDMLKNEKIKDDYKLLVICNNDFYNNKIKDNKNKVVIRENELFNYINESEKKTHIVRQEKKIKSICDKILKYNVKR